VVNLILKSQYNGWEAGGRYGFSSRAGHYRERSGYLVGGVSTGRTSVLVAFEAAETDPLYLSARPFSNPIYGSAYYPGIIDVFSLSDYSDQRYQLNPRLNAPPGGGQYTLSQLVAMGVYLPITAAQATNGFNLASAETLLQSLTRRSGVLKLKQKIFRDTFYAFADLVYSQSRTRSSLNGQPLPPYVSTPYLNYATYQLPSAAPTYLPPPAGALYLPAGTPTNPFSTAYLNQGSPDDQSAGNIVTVHNRFLDYPRVYEVAADTYHLVGGLGGRINPDYFWEAAADLNRYSLNYTNSGLIDSANFDAALAAGTINPFAYTQAPGALPGNVVGSATLAGLSTLNSFDAVFRGTPFALPAGKLGFAAGFQFWRETLADQPDANSIPDANGDIGWANTLSLVPFSAQRRVSSAYGEIAIPLVAPSQGVPGVSKLEVDLAGRVDQYSQIGRSRVPKVNLLWKPGDDQLALRASAGRSFSAPTLYDLYGPVTSGSTQTLSFNNYAGGGSTQNVQFEDVTGANGALKPATATTWSAGFVYSPRAVRTLSLTVDYYQTVEKLLVGSFDENAMAQSVESAGPASPYAGYVHFGSAAGRPVTAPGELSTANPTSVFFSTPFVNLAGQAVKGCDGSVEYQSPPGAAGRLDFTTAFTVYNSYLVQAIPTEDYYQYAGHATGNGSASNGTIPRWRNYSTLGWDGHGWAALAGYTFIPAVTDIGPGGSAAFAPEPVASYQQWDFSLSYRFGAAARPRPDRRWFDGLTLRLGVNDAFDRLPPLAPGAFPDSNVDTSTYGGVVGRLYYASADYKYLVSPGKFVANY